MGTIWPALRHHRREQSVTDGGTSWPEIARWAIRLASHSVVKFVCFETDQYNNNYPMTELPGTTLPRLRPVPRTVSVTRGAAATQWLAEDHVKLIRIKSVTWWSLLTSRGGWALVDYFCARSTHCGGLVESVKAKFNLIQGVDVTEATSLFTSVLTQSDSPVQYWITHWLAGLAVQLVSVVEPGWRRGRPGRWRSSGEGSPLRAANSIVYVTI